MPGWLTWIHPEHSKTAGVSPEVEEALRKLGIRHYDEDLLEMPIKKLREHFGYATTANIRLREFFRNVIWQLHERIQAGDRPDFYNKHGMIRGMWYHIKTRISRYKVLRGDRYDKMLAELAELVRNGLVTYKDFNFRDKDENNHLIGLDNSHIILLAEKDGFLTIMEDLHALYGCTVITLGGDPSLMTVNFLVTDMQGAGVDVNQEFVCLTVMDFDPDGQEAAEVFVRHLKASGLLRYRAFTQFGREDRDHLDLIVPANLPSGVEADDVKFLLKKPVREQKAAKWVKLTGGVPGLSPRDKLRYGIESDEFHVEWIRDLVGKAVAPYLRVGSEVVERRATMGALEKVLKDLILYRVLHPGATVA